MGLFEWGISLIDKADTNLQIFGKKFGFMPLSWGQVIRQYPNRKGLMWRVPDPQVQMASSLFNVQAILVTEYEMAMVLRDGALGEQVIMPPGLYDIHRATQLRGQIEVIWFSTQQFQLLWGVGDVLTQDRVTVGASGHYSAAIVDPEAFMRNVGGHEQVYTEKMLQEFAKYQVSNAIRNMIAKTTVMEFQQAQPEIERACREALITPFATIGLEFRGLTIDTQSIPEEFRQAAQRRVLVTMDNEAEMELLKLKMQQSLIQAESIRMIGNAQAQVMQSQIGIGLDPLELQRIEAMKILAEHPAEGSLIDNRPQIVSQLMPQQLIAPPPAPVIVNGTPYAPPMQQQIAPTGGLPAPTSPPAPAPANEPMSREKIQDMLDKLDERFANGEMSEQLYLNMQDKWQKRLDRL